MTEGAFATDKTPTSTAKAVGTFNKIIRDAAKLSVPFGYRRYFDPTLCPEALNLIQQRDDLRRSNPADPNIATLNEKISKHIKESARSKWRP